MKGTTKPKVTRRRKLKSETLQKSRTQTTGKYPAGTQTQYPAKVGYHGTDDENDLSPEE